MTITQAADSMIQRYDYDGASDVLRDEGLLLLPTDALWCVACLADDPVGIERLRRIKRQQPNPQYELLFSSLDMLKQYAQQLHPRLETLLVYHARPLTILTPAHHSIRPEVCFSDGRMAARVVRDQYCRQLIEHLGRPLATTTAHFPGSPLPNHLGRVRSDIIEKVDYVAKYRPRQAASGQPAVMVQMNAQDELEFLRE